MRSSGNGRTHSCYGSEDAFVPDTFLGARPSSRQAWYLKKCGVWRDNLSRRQAHWLIEGLKTGIVVPNGG